ncbi:hypothetical protein PIROE2DRAFT_11690 [Piromyces sp. E2]|nr:hypothetical protein PIROE2DRAFT_11690 [Piromyces sp. E2]|eukprot:OUM62136.1 hypothetical protein PIROE2DRAFT_11690 [Piromyces sp. E2]
MDFSKFEDLFFSHLKENNNECFKDILENEKIIETYLCDDNVKYLNSFINKFNDIVINRDGKFKFLEKVLNEKLFNNVLKKFRNSTILVRACEKKNVNLINWLLTMDIDTYVQNENGMTALMAASKDPKLFYVVKHIIGHNSSSINIRDKNGENALFYAIYNMDTFKFLLDSNINVNCLNNNNDSILTFCCRNKIYEPIELISAKNSVDVNIFNNDERTAAMYLIEDGRYQELSLLINDNINFYYKNGKNETSMTILFKKYYELYKQLTVDISKILPYINIIKILVNRGYSKDLDLSMKNKKGESFCSLLLKYKPTVESYYSGINIHYLFYYIFCHPTFDVNVRDNFGNNVVMNYIITDNLKSEYSIDDIFKARKEYFSAVNEDHENALIITSKLGRRKIIKLIISAEGSDINHQDILGNTALHYAVMLNDYYIADTLAYYHADINIKNKDGLSPINIVKESKDSTMLKLLLKPFPPYEIKKMEKKSKSKISFRRKYELRELKEDLRNKYLEKYTSGNIDEKINLNIILIMKHHFITVDIIMV